MKKNNLKDFFKGWFIGDFEPSLLRSPDFEVAVKDYSAGDKENKHVHKKAVEFTVVLDGVISMNDVKYFKNDIITIDKYESTIFKSITDSRTLVIKTPSVKGDKYIIDETDITQRQPRKV